MTCTSHHWLRHWSLDDPFDDSAGTAICAWCETDGEWHENMHGERITTIRGKEPHVTDYDDFTTWLDATETH